MSHTNERTHATISPARYTTQAREDFVSRGLAVRTLGSFASGILLVEIDGNREQAQRWISEIGGDRIRPLPRGSSAASAYSREQARELVESALLAFDGAQALAFGSQALALVGLDGLDEIAHTLADSNRVEEAYMLRGALAALVGEPLPPEIGGAYECDSAYGFAFVPDSARGSWAGR